MSIYALRPRAVPGTVQLQTLCWEYNKDADHIDCFGSTVSGTSIHLEIRGFEPFFYVKAKDTDSLAQVQKFLEWAEETLETQFTVESVFLKDFYGFQAEQKFKFYKIYCERVSSLYTARKVLEKKGYKMYESHVDQLLRFFHVTKLKPCGTVQVKGAKESLGNCQLEWSGTFDAIEPVAGLRANVLQTSIDIESYSHNLMFPDPEEALNVITHIGITYKWTLDDNFCLYVCLSLGKVDILPREIDGVKTIHKVFENESDLLLEFQKVIVESDPDLLISFNGDGFDWGYIYKRFEHNKLVQRLGRLGRPDTLEHEVFESTQRGRTEFNRVKSSGRLFHDILITVKREYNLSSYKLDSIAKEYLGEQKIEMKYSDVFASFKESNAPLAKKVAEYCVQDTRLNQRLYDHFKFFQGNVEMANICWVPYHTLVTGGETVKVMSLVLEETLRLGLVIPRVPGYSLGYEGATVLEPRKLGIFKGPIITLDFASLYPSIIMAHNLCYMTIVMDDKYLGLPGYEYKTFTLDFKDPDTGVTQTRTLTYVDNVQGLSGDILKRIGQARKDTKKIMKTVKDKNSFEYTILDKRQLSYKLVMNSYYGFMAAKKLSCPEIAGTVTLVGRTMIQQIKEWVDTKVPGAQSIYGDTDSLFVDIFATADKKDFSRQDLLEKALDLGPRLAQDITKLFKAPILLEFEKVYGGVGNFIMIAKKKYMGPLYTRPDKYDKIDHKGIVLKRRDNFEYMKTVYSSVMDLLIWKDDPKTEIEKYLKVQLENLSSGKVDLKDLTYSTKYSGNYKNPEGSLAHVLTEKMRKRNPLTCPKPGERMNYCYVKLPTSLDRLAKNAHRAEDPEYVKENKLPVDYNIYIQKMENPVKELIENITNADSIFFEYKPSNFKRKNPGNDPRQKRLDAFVKKVKR